MTHLSRNTGPRALAAYAVTIGIAATGSVVFFLLNLPLPWMLGAMAITLAAAVSQIPLQTPEKIRPVVTSVIGVMLGSGFTPDTFSHLGQWAYSLVALLGCILVSAVGVAYFFVRVGRMDPVTALFSAMPGGMIEMMDIGRKYGGDERTIIIAHAARIVLVISLVAFWFRVVLGHEVSGVVTSAHTQSGPVDLVILLLCAVVGAYCALRADLPAPTFLGPMVASAIAHMVGLTNGAPPAGLVIIAQVVLGTIVGCRFIGVSVRQVLRAFALGFGATVLMLGIAIGFAYALSAVLHQTPEQILLAYAPGGLSEMGLVALTLGGDVAYIATHHLFRITVLLVAAAPILGRVAKWLSTQQARPKPSK